MQRSKKYNGTHKENSGSTTIPSTAVFPERTEGRHGGHHTAATSMTGSRVVLSLLQYYPMLHATELLIGSLLKGITSCEIPPGARTAIEDSANAHPQQCDMGEAQRMYGASSGDCIAELTASISAFQE